MPFHQPSCKGQGMQHDKPDKGGADEDKTEQADDHGDFSTWRT
jgi:hypothetical protein